MVGAARVGGAVASVSLSRPQMTYVELKPMRITDELRHNYAHLHNYLHIPVIIRTFNLIWLHAAMGGGGARHYMPPGQGEPKRYTGTGMRYEVRVIVFITEK